MFLGMRISEAEYGVPISLKAIGVSWSPIKISHRVASQDFWVVELGAVSRADSKCASEMIGFVGDSGVRRGC